MTSKDPTQQAQAGPAAEAITGVQAMRGEGVHVAKGFWAEAWAQVLKQPKAVAGLVWVAITTALAVLAPVIASGHPIVLWELDDAGERTSMRSPMLEHLTPVDWMLLLAAGAMALALVLPMPLSRGKRVGLVLLGLTQALATVVVASVFNFVAGAGAGPSPWLVGAGSAVAAGVAVACFPLRAVTRATLVPGVALSSCVVVAMTADVPPSTYPYGDLVRSGQAQVVYTIVPWSPAERSNDRNTLVLSPGESSGSSLERRLIIDVPPIEAATDAQLADIARLIPGLPIPAGEGPAIADAFTDRFIDADPSNNPGRDELSPWLRDQLRPFGRTFYAGTDSLGQDVLSQLIHASRLAMSIGLVSTGIAVLIGITIGAVMGYFGGLIDLALYRVVEVFMAVPVLFILIVAAGVLPAELRNTYVMMAIFGLFTWHAAARFTRAEFLRLRSQDFVQSARAVGLPLRSVLFKHMLPNGVTPVLVDASFRIALAILFESILSFLGLGPVDQPSWGKLLSDVNNAAGGFVWWLAIYPGVAIFLTVLSYNLIGEALRDAIDPKLKKARVS